MQKIIIEIETNDPEIVVENITGEKHPAIDTITQIRKDVNLNYQGTMQRRAVDVPSLCYFVLGFVISSLGGEVVTQIAMWFLEKLDKLPDKIIRINGRKTEMSSAAISKAIELATSETSIEDQIRKLLTEVDQFSEIIIPSAQERRLHTEEFYEGFPCAGLWGAYDFYTTIVTSIEQKLVEVKRLMHFCVSPIAISDPKEGKITHEPKS